MQLHNGSPFGMLLNFATENNFNFAVDSPFVASWANFVPIVPPVGNLFLLLNGSPMLLLNGDNLALL
jgi:hypothetical protein